MGSGSMSWEQIWQKYAGKKPEGEEKFDDDVYLTIVQKACSTNTKIDKLLGCNPASLAAVEAASDLADVGQVLGEIG